MYGIETIADRYGSMCKMDKYNKINAMENRQDKTQERNGKIDDILLKKIKSLFLSYHADATGFTYKAIGGDNSHIVLDIGQGLLLDVTAKKFARIALQDRDMKMRTIRSKGKEYRILVLMRVQHWQGQSIFSAIKSAYSCMSNIKENWKLFENKLISLDVKMLMADLFALILNIREGYFTPTKFMTTLLSIVTLYKRGERVFTPQSLTMEDIMLGFAAYGLPASVTTLMKDFQIFTGKRLFNSELIMDSVSLLYKVIDGMLEWCGPSFNGLRTSVSGVFGPMVVYSFIQQVVLIYNKFVKDPSVIHIPSFRQEVVELDEKCKGNAELGKYLAESHNRYFNTTYLAFNENVVKMCKHYDTTSRVEPICFVFEGKAGSGKSTIMNQFVDLMKEAGKSVYVHTVPSTEDSKDFYDDYENQDVFVMDDVGQQGKSQWRTIINFVSPVKYPLACANAIKKNTKFFSSKIILCTTNQFESLQGFTSSDCITEPEALFRRVHLIKVSSDETGRVLTYKKYDHLGSHKWETGFINNLKQIELPARVNSTGSGNVPGLSWLWRLYKRVTSIEQEVVNGIKNAPEVLRAIMAESCSDFFDAQAFDISSIYQSALAGMHNAGNIIGEWTIYVMNRITGMITSGTESLLAYLDSLSSNTIANMVGVVGGLLGLVIGLGLQSCLFANSSTVDAQMAEWETFEQEARSKIAMFITKHGFMPQGAEVEKSLAKHSRVISLTRDSGEQETLHCIVSGSNLLLPAHVLVDKKTTIDMYASWDHYKNSHKEVESVNLRLLALYPSVDMAVYKMKYSIPIYTKCKALFAPHTIKNPMFKLVNAGLSVPVVLGISMLSNTEEIKYTKYKESVKHEFKHAAESGYITPLQGAGMCGTMLASDEYGIIGMHVAGNGSEGFCVIPPPKIRQEIRTLMLEGDELIQNLEPTIGVIPNLSGARMHYDNIVISQPMAETEFIPTILNTKFNEEMQELRRTIKEEHGHVLVDRVPPNFKSKGTPRATLKEMSMKTFKQQGRVTQDEIEYIKTCLRSMMVDFSDVTDQECSFGGDTCNPLNKDSSNGYGCLTGKDKYFDFENKVILPTFIDLKNRLSDNAKNAKYNIDDFLCRETFKDELRYEEKKDKPRTFRVMPLPHIWWTKKIFAQLMVHFKKHMHEFGVCVGFNPYKDFAIMRERLLENDVFGDADFAKWDGSIMALIMFAIFEVLMEFYQGEHEDEAEYLFITLARSMVLIGDEVWATTHGLPTGTWLTLLLNCLINKSITALVVYRNKRDATVKDFHSIVDYVMGDDKIFSTPKHLKDVFNLITLRDVVKDLGMDCTNGDKTPIVSPGHEFNKLNYLKREFKYHAILGKYVGALSLDTIFSTVQYVDQNRDYTETMNGKMNAVLIEAFIHSESLYHQFAHIFKSNYPDYKFLNKERVIRILEDGEGYEEVLNLMGKNITH